MTDDDLKIVEFIARHEATLQVVILMKYGFSFDLANSLDPIQRFAYVVACKEMFEPVYFDFDQKRWKEKPQNKVLGKL